jgi:acyl-CoA dehydrogenase
VTTEPDGEFLAGIAAVAEVAGEYADAVDREARFPQEALDALRERRALSALVPRAQGGADVSLEAVAQAAALLGRRCGATGMVFAMHSIQVSCIARHLDDAPRFADYLAEIVAEQRLIGSVTSEVQTGGDLGRSSAAVEADGDRSRFVKQAPTVSYGAQADDLLTTLRRHADSEAGDQVLVLTRRGEHTLEPVGGWDTLGMRGTCSPGFVVRGDLPSEQVLPTPFARISAETMVPVSHLLWSHVWLGIAEDAFARARAFVRKGKAGGPAGDELTRLHGELVVLRATVATALAEFARASAVEGRPELATMAAALRANTLKLTSSELAAKVCAGALAVCGIAGFRNDTAFSVGRHLRDALSAQVMVANSRLRASNADLLLVVKDS